MTDRPYKDSLERLLNAEVAPPHEIARLDRVMQYRNAEAMNGLSNRLDKIVETAEASGNAQSKQQRAMIALTTVLAVATVAYTVTTIWSTMKTLQPTALNSVAESVTVRPVFADKQGAEAALAK